MSETEVISRGQLMLFLTGNGAMELAGQYCHEVCARTQWRLAQRL